MKTLASAAQWLFVVSLPFLLLTTSIAVAANSLWLYEYGFRKYAASQRTGLADEELEKAAAGLIGYFNSDEELINLTVMKNGQPFVLFNQREVSHLKDVKGLIRLDYRVLLGTLVYASAYTVGNLLWEKRHYRRRLAWGTVAGSGLTLALMFALGLGTLLGFDRLFRQFHIISFTNELWQLNPSRDYLIMLFPRGFWYDATLFCALGAALVAVALGGAAGWYLARLKASGDLS